MKAKRADDAKRIEKSITESQRWRDTKESKCTTIKIKRKITRDDISMSTSVLNFMMPHNLPTMNF
ncbi:hypothetical protein KUTeg_000366 [Tegillarca granosa]|uniref:Uncharacterized protein n=1 Tax=Tegillarca granosa TaxID=220873 RepID=A0ABQ9G047_TEGGR|nr:hypothetical protein KUTeg_000366 [Tegillarca granosa]